VRDFITQLVEINQLLNDFPPFAADQALPEDEILDIAEFAVPTTWQKAMVLQGFDPTGHLVNEFIEFCERLEFAEGTHIGEQPNKKSCNGDESRTDPSGCQTGALKRPAKSSARGNKKQKHSSDNGKFCELHHTTDHDTGECEVLKAQAHKMRANWETHRSKYGRNKRIKLNNNNDDKKSKTREEVHAIDDQDFEDRIRKILKELLPRNSKNGAKKQKNDNLNVEEFNNLRLSDDDTDSDNEGEE